MKIWKRKGLSLIAVLGLGLAAPFALISCEDDEGFGDEMENAGDEIGQGFEDAGDAIGEGVDETTEEFGE